MPRLTATPPRCPRRPSLVDDLFDYTSTSMAIFPMPPIASHTASTGVLNFQIVTNEYCGIHHLPAHLPDFCSELLTYAFTSDAIKLGPYNQVARVFVEVTLYIAVLEIAPPKAGRDLAAGAFGRTQLPGSVIL